MRRLHLNELKPETEATVLSIEGGHAAGRRLESLGIRPGVRIKKISKHFWQGPVTVLVKKTKIAIGHGMAEKVIVEVER